ncbi:hypothetical protein [Nocardia cyriacigeorgica]|uniref:Uncharacterized protein n=1 Tax=Nocardia cyriacigeorgica TaxID=135487 RepID=A0A5R8NGL3_9NOCA|nr:hypothetical protein [Nocardia cyriacigeorgica]TLF74835.1 hypothetical protein FEK34_22855 [Nocardia cyriacigeorgica]
MAHSFAVAAIAIFSTVALVALVTGAVAHVVGARARRTADFCFVGDWIPTSGYFRHRERQRHIERIAFWSNLIGLLCTLGGLATLVFALGTG